MRSCTLLAVLGTPTLLWATAGCGSEVDAQGCFEHQDLVEQDRVGLELHNRCEPTGFCVMKVAFRCDGQPAELATTQFTVDSLGTTTQWADAPCDHDWEFTKRWLCEWESFPHLDDPSL